MVMKRESKGWLLAPKMALVEAWRKRPTAENCTERSAGLRTVMVLEWVP